MMMTLITKAMQIIYASLLNIGYTIHMSRLLIVENKFNDDEACSPYFLLLKI